MANHVYNYNQSYGGSTLSTAYSSRLSGTSITDPYLSDTSLTSSRFLSSNTLTGTDASKFSVIDKGSMYLNHNDSLKHFGGIGAGALSTGRVSGGFGAITPWSGVTQTSWTGAEPHSVLHAPAVDPAVAGMKRPVEAVYHQNTMGIHSAFGQSDSLFSTNPLAKHPRIESASNLPVYPQRPGEKDCIHYMMTRTCKFGDACKFDHPIWVPQGGVPDWKEVPLIPNSESLPERPGEPDCPYYLKTQKCKFAFKCKFNHPKDLDALNASITADGNAKSDSEAAIVLPERPTEPLCTLYAKTGICKFGLHCKFNHPKDLPIPTDGTVDEKPDPFAPALLHNSKGLPIRPGVPDCPFYLKTGSCKFGATCRHNHPDRTAINPTVAAGLGLGHTIINSPAINLPFGVVNPAAAVLPHASLDPRLAQNALAFGPTVYPQRPGELECDYFMKNGDCKYGQRCKFHHPLDRSPALVKQQALQQNVKLTLAGFPRREGAITCAFYMKTGTCKYGQTCIFDHPPPGEAIAMIAAKGTTVEEVTPAEEAEQ